MEVFSKAFIERNKDDSEFSLFSTFPYGCCEYSSSFLASYLISKNPSLTINVVLVENPEDRYQLHAWLIVDSLHIDITGYQFDKPLPKVIVSEENPWNVRFSTINKIERIYFKHDTNYGSPKVHQALKKEGLGVNRKRVERIMVGKAGNIYRRKAVPDKFYTKMPNVKKDLSAPATVDQQWVADLTCLTVAQKQLYLAVAMDLYSRRII